MGIVAIIRQEIGLIERIDLQVESDGRKVSCGQATQAVILNALGFVGRAMHLMPDYLHNKPVDVLIDPVLAAEDFNLDSRSFLLHGAYDADEPKREAIRISNGYSRDHRPDLKQMVLQLITHHKSALPIWLEVLSGNSNDKKTFKATIQAYTRQLRASEQPYLVMDRVEVSPGGG